jgi:hypothetical protein
MPTGGELRYQVGGSLASAEIGEVVRDVAFIVRTSQTIDVIAEGNAVPAC